MKVSELIDLLKDYPQDAQVKILSDIDGQPSRNGLDSCNYYATFRYYNMNKDHIDFYKERNIVQLGG